MAAVTGLTTVKRFLYRGDASEEFSNTYHFKSPPPGDDSSWNVVLNDLLVKEQSIFTSTVTFVRAYGYNSDDEHAHHVFAHDWTLGTPPVGNMPVPNDGVLMAGDQAAMLRWKTARLNSRGKPIYLRKYVHHGYVASTDHDALSPIYLSHLDTFTSPSGVNGVHGGLRSRSHDEQLTFLTQSQWVTTRTLKRRGKRPPPGG